MAYTPKDIFVRLTESSANESSHELYCRCMDAAAEIKRLRLAAERYETARRMNPRQWADAWKLNTTTGKPFDEIIDDLRPS